MNTEDQKQIFHELLYAEGVQKVTFLRTITQELHKIESCALHSHLEIQCRTYNNVHIKHSIQFFLCLHHSARIEILTQLTMDDCDRSLCVLDRARDGGQERVIDQVESGRGVTADDMEIGED